MSERPAMTNPLSGRAPLPPRVRRCVTTGLGILVFTAGTGIGIDHLPPRPLDPPPIGIQTDQ